MKILLVGSNKNHCLEYYYRHYLEKMNVNCNIYPAHDMFMDYYNGVTNKMVFRLGVSRIYYRINKDLIDLVKRNKYDVILVFKGMEIFPRTLNYLSAKVDLICN